MLTPSGLQSGTNNKMRNRLMNSPQKDLSSPDWTESQRSGNTTNTEFYRVSILTCYSSRFRGLPTSGLGTVTLETASISLYSLSVGASQGCCISPLFDHHLKVHSLVSRQRKSYQPLLSFLSGFLSCLGTASFQPR